MSDVELVVDARVEVAEVPVWHDGALWWIDVLGCDVHRYDPRTGADDLFDVGQMIGSLVPRRSGGFVLALRDGFATWEGPGSDPRLIAPVEKEEPTNRLNDGKCDRQGRYWASTMELRGTSDSGSFYRLDCDFNVTKHLSGLWIGNGLAWSADGTRLYYIDSLTYRVDVFDYDEASGEIRNRRPFVDVGGNKIFPDGMTIDAEDYLWVAVFGEGQVRRFTPRGELDRVINLPVSNVTCCTFGGENLKDLYITTAWHALSDERRETETHAGGVFVAHPGVVGTPAEAFGG